MICSLLSRNRPLILFGSPKFTWLLLPALFWKRQIYIFDFSLIDFVSRSEEISRFLGVLEKIGLREKIFVIRSSDYAGRVWDSNEASVKAVLRWVKALRVGRGQRFFFGGYIAHVRRLTVARRKFVKLFFRDQRLSEPSLKPPIFRSPYGNCLSKLLCGALRALHYPILLSVMTWFALRYVSISKTPSLLKDGGICVDLIHGPTNENDQALVYHSGYSDTFMVGSHPDFTAEKHTFLAHDPIVPDRLRIEHTVAGLGAQICGPGGGRTRMSLVCLCKIVHSVLLIARKMYVSDRAPLGGWCSEARWLQIKFLIDLFRAKLTFATFRPKVYLSRLDYSHKHHVYGFVCEESGINFSGICHSPLGGLAHTPNFSINSFQTYFSYKPIFWDKFYPSWKESRARLVPIGVWRSDFIKRADSHSDHKDFISTIKSKLLNRFIVGVHLPPAGAYLFDTDRINYWMSSFIELVEECPDVSFIFLRRRSSRDLKYYRRWCEELSRRPNSFMSDHFAGHLKQSYALVSACNLTIGCAFSDAVLESLACGIPALSYQDVGRGRSQLELFDSSLAVYDGAALIKSVRMAKSGVWPSAGLWKKIRNQLTGDADGCCIKRMSDVLVTQNFKYH